MKKAEDNLKEVKKPVKETTKEKGSEKKKDMKEGDGHLKKGAK